MAHNEPPPHKKIKNPIYGTELVIWTRGKRNKANSRTLCSEGLCR